MTAVLAASSQAWMPVVGIAAVSTSVFVLAIVLFAPTGRRRLARQSMKLSLRQPAPSLLTGVTSRATQIADESLERRGRREKLGASLDQAGIAMKPAEFLVLEIAVALAACLVGFAIAGLLGAIVLGCLTALGFRGYLSWQAATRRAKFADQLGDTLQLLTGSLRAGYGLLQAVDGIAREAESPTSDEFRRLVLETRLGRSMPDALHGIAERVGNDDFEWVIQAIEINRDVGGELAEVLERVNETIRERDRVRRQIRTMSAEGRFSVKLLLALPILLAVFQQANNPDFLGLLTGTSTGLLLLGVGTALLIVGGIWLRKIVTIPF